ncbi:hypothetical protein SOM08_14400 [Hydrogenophaga sp. SNF1]|uniref:hypothetical protein n=1 Tax=Hydrogenophaga sp. SNF1 TaxID=3098762 RepID=UPI002ACC1BDE|nr:hypothetical protein [Hydrogenophaga sp. SNF1]WQB82188.1 hypothetical protein SOM08_14400 [Hydrogenophaga sp. SNF1]
MPLLTYKIAHVPGERSVVWFLVNYRSRWDRGFSPHLLFQQLVTIIYVFPRDYAEGNIEWNYRAINSQSERFASYWIVGRRLALQVCAVLEKLGVPKHDGPVRSGHVHPPYIANGNKPLKRGLMMHPPDERGFTWEAQVRTAEWYADNLLLYERRERWRGRSERLQNRHEPYLLDGLWADLDKCAARARRQAGIELTVFQLATH